MSRPVMKKSHKLIQATTHWKFIAPLLTYPKNNREYEELVSRLDELLDIVGDNEKHHLIGLVDAMSNLIAAYEKNNQKDEKTNGVAALKFLMESNNLKQSDLPEIGSQGVVSEILNGKRVLNIRQMKLLAKRFDVDVDTFIDE